MFVYNKTIYTFVSSKTQKRIIMKLFDTKKSKATSEQKGLIAHFEAGGRIGRGRSTKSYQSLPLFQTKKEEQMSIFEVAKTK